MLPPCSALDFQQVGDVASALINGPGVINPFVHQYSVFPQSGAVTFRDRKDIRYPTCIPKTIQQNQPTHGKAIRAQAHVFNHLPELKSHNAAMDSKP